MDELKLSLSTKFMKGIVTKIVKKIISNKLGYEVGVLLNEISLVHADGKVRVHIDVDMEINNDDFVGIIKDTGLL